MLLGIVILIYIFSYFSVKQKIIALAKNKSRKIDSLPYYYGYCAVILNIFTSISVFIYSLIHKEEQYLLFYSIGLNLLISILLFFTIRPSFRARFYFEKFTKLVLFLVSIISVSITVFVVITLFQESLKFFEKIPLQNFLFGFNWRPQVEDHDLELSSFGALPVFWGTLLITLIAMVIALPIGLFSAIYLTEYAGKYFSGIAKAVIEVLAGIPTVIYGYFAAVVLGPYIRKVGEYLGLEVASESALAAGIVMGIMVIPLIMSLSYDVIRAVPKSLREAAMALGSTKYETSFKIVFPAALSGIMAAILLALSRAIGETMIVTMAAGLNADMNFNPLKSVTTVTAQIVNLLVGDQEFDSTKTMSAFALALTLFFITFCLNILSLIIVNKYKEKYE